jgi:putative transposase
MTEAEKALILSTCNSEEFKDSPPTQIVPTLLDRGVYIGSESTLYRVLREAGQINHRGRMSSRKKRALPETYAADGPNQVWTWDISYCPTTVKGLYFYLYIIMDIYSRKVVGYEVHSQECGSLASILLQKALISEGNPDGVVLHSDNGAPMKSVTFKAKMKELEVQPSYSRPRVSNDNPYSESLFRTVKYAPSWPAKGFSSLEEAQSWAHSFVVWYNSKHRHSKIQFVTPNQRHLGEDKEILAQRKLVIAVARDKHPDRWSRNIRNCEAEGVVTLNPAKKDREEMVKKAA